MDLVSILGIAVGLAMDAFAVAMATSVMLRGVSARQTFRFAFHFGLFQFLMPVIGWAAGRTVSQWVASWDHWVAFGLLCAIGGKAIWSALSSGKDETRADDPTRGLSLVLLSLATSLDALAVGLSFAMIKVDIWYPSIIIGLVATVFTALGMGLGNRLGGLLGRRVEVLGGVVLIAIGLKIVVGHVAGPPNGTARSFDARNVLAIQREPEDPATGRYDWGTCVIRDGSIYRMWWVRLGGDGKRRFPASAVLADGSRFEFTYPDRGDRIYYAESRDGRRWGISGPDFTGAPESYSAEASGPLQVLGPSETEEERNHIGCPSMVKVDGTFHLYYEAPCEYAASRLPDGNVVLGDEFHNQVFAATSKDGRRWTKHPSDDRPRPIVPAPAENRGPGRRRYGLGQPSVFHRDGKYVMHYVDSCTGPGDCIVRIEADNPLFRDARRAERILVPPAASPPLPAGTVARFAQVDVKFLGDSLWLLRPAWGTGGLGVLASRDGVFASDAAARRPAEVFPQVRIADPRGAGYQERLFPRFLTGPEGEILLEDGAVVVFYGSGLGFKDKAFTWDVHRAELPWVDLERIAR